MPHILGVLPVADRAWLDFLTSPHLVRREKAALLRSKILPTDALTGCSQLDDTTTDSGNFPGKALPRWSMAALPEIPTTLLHLGEVDESPAGYPALLGDLNDAPLALFVAGDRAVFNRPAVAVVGTRHPSRDGARLAEDLGFELARAGFTVVSGLARGIDAAAHRGALRAGGYTVAVMATGMDRIYPAEHQHLAAAICRSGALVTEFCPGVAPQKAHFPRRNRTISGLSLATVVVEAGRPSGSLITATAAAQQGREVYAAPWSVYHRGGTGCNHLLAEGAQVYDTPARLISSLAVEVRGWRQLQARELQPTQHSVFPGDEATPTIPLSKDAEDLLCLLGDAELDIGEMLAASGLSLVHLQTLVTHLELGGFIQQTAAGYRRLR